MLPSRFYRRSFTAVKSFNVALYHGRNSPTTYWLAFISLGASVLKNFLPEFVDSLNKLPPQSMILNAIEPLQIKLIACWSNQHKALSVREISHYGFFNLPRIFVDPSDAALVGEAIIEILSRCYFLPLLVLKL